MCKLEVSSCGKLCGPITNLIGNENETIYLNILGIDFKEMSMFYFISFYNIDKIRKLLK